MGILDLSNTRQVPGYADAPVAGAHLQIFSQSTSSLSPVYRDPDLTLMVPNDLIADANGAFPVYYLIDGTYQLEFTTSQGDQTINNVVVDGNVPLIGEHDFATFTALVSDETVTLDNTAMRPGDLIRVSDSGYAYKLATATATDIHFRTQTGAGLYALPERGAVYSFDQIGATPGVDSTALLDDFLNFAWANYTKKMSLILPDETVIAKNGDFMLPPNLSLKGAVANARLIYGNAATRLVLARDNDRVSVINGVNYAFDGNYWSLGPNIIEDLSLEADGVTGMTAFLQRDLVFSQYRKITIGGTGTPFAVGVHMQNVDKWNEYWVFDDCTFTTSDSCLLFDRDPSSPYESFGHGAFRGKLSARAAGAAAVRIRGGASVYNSKWDVVGFCTAPASGTDAHLFKLEDAGSDMKHAQIRAHIENLGNQGTPYAIHASGGADAGKINGTFTGVGSETKFHGVTGANVVSTLSNRITRDGTEITGLNGVTMKVTDQPDIDGNNMLRYAGEQMISYTQQGAAQANGTVGVLPLALNTKARVISIQIKAGTAPSGNSTGGWSLGLVRTGATNPLVTITLPDGATEAYQEIDFEIPAGWIDEPGNFMSWRGLAGAGNDGTGPQDVTLLLNWYPG